MVISIKKAIAAELEDSPLSGDPNGPTRPSVSIAIEEKYNTNHDELGRFTFAPARGGLSGESILRSNPRFEERFQAGLKGYGLIEKDLNRVVEIYKDPNTRGTTHAAEQLADEFGEDAFDLPYNMWKFTIPSDEDPKSFDASKAPPSYQFAGPQDAVAGVVLTRLAGSKAAGISEVHRAESTGRFGDLKVGDSVNYSPMDKPFTEFTKNSPDSMVMLPFFADSDIYTIRNPSRGFDYQKYSAQSIEGSFITSGNYKVVSVETFTGQFGWDARQFVLEDVGNVAKALTEVHIAPPIEKYNTNHDELGRFTFSGQGVASRAVREAAAAGPVGPPSFDVDYVNEQIAAGNVTVLGERGVNPSYKVTDPETGQEYHVKTADEFEVEREIVARQIAEEMGVEEFVPTIYDIGDAGQGGGEYPVALRNERMVASEWVEGEQLFRTSDADTQAVIDGMSDSQLTKMMAYEMTLANSDRHFGNVMITDQGKIALIDNGNILSRDVNYTEFAFGRVHTPAPFSILRRHARDRQIDKALLTSMTDDAARAKVVNLTNASGIIAPALLPLDTRMSTANNIGRNPSIQTWGDAFAAYGG